MSEIHNIGEPWSGHTGLEVETFIKAQLEQVLSSDAKIGWVTFDGTAMHFYEDSGMTTEVCPSISFAGDIFNISISTDAEQVFYILADETEKLITFSASTRKSEFGSSESEPYPEGYSYAVAVNTGGGYITRITGTIGVGESATFDVRPYVATGDNYIRISVTGLLSEQTRSTVLTATLTTLTLSANHAWQDPWMEDENYIISGIRFAGSVQKTLHVAIDGVEQTPAVYGPNQSYTTSATTYQLPASAFPASSGNGVHTVTLWMTAGSVSTPVITYHIMCVAENDNTPMVAINDIVPLAVNFTSADILGYAVYNADKAVFNMSATIGGQTYTVNQSPITMTGLSDGYRYTLSYSIEIDTGLNTATLGTLTATGASYDGSTHGLDDSRTTNIDNTYSYIATPGALFYLNAATRDNSETNYQSIVNEMGASQDGNFAASYPAVWSGLSWTNDGWAVDPANNKALVIPAGASVVVTDFTPLFHVASYSTGLTVEMMLQCGSPSDYSQPVFQMFDNGSGIKIYPTKISVFGSLEGSEVLQSVNFSENKMTHLTITFTKNYEGVSTRNLVSVYINGISNVNFSFSGSSVFGSGPLTIGQQNTDAYLYRMRVYGQALEPRAVFNNFLNCVIENAQSEFNRRQQYEANEVVEGGGIDYDACKEAGYNTMVVIMDSPSHDIPSFNNQASYDGCTMRFEYYDEPTRNVTVSNVSIDGQGTTSKQYYRWNLRAKTNSNTVWTYADGTSVQGKEGYFAGTDRPKVDRITAKKNYASSMQGHKMGFTGLYNDLFKQLGFGDELPNEDYLVAVYQYPFVGFKYNSSNDTYEYIGLYTAGPDKGSKVTFGYASSYDNLLSLEGPNHDPRGTRFLTPWVDVTYSYQDETLKFGGEEGWDCDYVGGGLSSDKSTDAAAILQLYENEWRPAYELVYHCSPYIANLTDTGKTLSQINADITTFLSGSTNGVKNQLLSFYDSNYDLIFFRNSTGQFDYLTAAEGKSSFNVRTYLGLTGSPTTAQIIAARAAKFKANMGNYWSLNQALYHYCFCILFGVTDNFAKNTYPFKFRGFEETLASGESVYCKRWGWRQDDLDTVMMTDNNGRNTKSYSVEHGDKTQDGVELYQGGDSAFWVLLRDNYTDEIRNAMIDLANAAADIATSLGIQGDGLHGSMFNLVSYYCWEKSAKYFAATLYEGDRRWSYLEPWLINATAVYNNVPPLTQALGDQYQAESLWMYRRIAYIFSKYTIGAFTGGGTGYGRMELTLAHYFTFNITPAIDLYPVISSGATDFLGGRTSAGNTTAITAGTASTGQTTYYIHGCDLIANLGDLSRMVLTSRGGSPDVEFTLNSARLQELKVGDAVAGNVDFNATTFSVNSPTVTSIDARNVTTFVSDIDLMNCPRLRTVYFAGSSARGLSLPKGAKLTDVSFPPAASKVFMHSLPFLDSSHLTLPSYAGIESLCINTCPNFNPLAIARDVLSTTGNVLKYLTLVWRGTLVASTADINALFLMTSLPGYVDDDGNTVNDVPWIEGSLSTTETMSSVTYAAIEDAFPKITLDVDLTKVYIDFADSNVESICLSHWDTDSSGVLTLNEARAVTTLNTYFRANTSITSFNELRFFEGLTVINGSGNTNGAFQNCTALTSIQLPKTVRTIGNYALAGCTHLASANFENITQFNDRACYNTPALAVELNCPELASWNGGNQFESSGITKIISLGRITSIPGGSSATAGTFAPCISLTEVTLPDTLTNIGSSAFSGCTSLVTVRYPSNNSLAIRHHAFYNDRLLESLPPANTTTIEYSAYENCASLTGELSLPNLSGTLGQVAFKNVGITKVMSLGSITSITGGTNSGAFQTCTSLTDVTLPTTLTSIGSYTFDGCTSLAHVNLPSSLRTVGDMAFRNAPSLAFTGGFENITTISANAFEKTGEYEVYLRDVTSLGAGAFKDARIKKLKIGPNLAIIGGGGNNGCFRQQNVSAASTSLTEVIIEGSGLREIGQECFKGRSGDCSYTLPTSIAIIRGDAFAGCGITGTFSFPNLSTLEATAFQNSKITKLADLGRITVINSWVFAQTSNLTEIIFPSTVTSVQTNIIYQSAVKKLVWQSTTPPSAVGSAFDGNSLYEQYVPSASIAQYVIATTWKGQACRIFPTNAAEDWIINGAYFNRSSNTYTAESNSSYCLTMPITIPDPYHELEFSFGFVFDGTDGHQCTLCLGTNNWPVTYYNANATTRTITPNNANIKTIRMTVSKANIANCYLKDNTSGTYLWRGDDANLVQY